MEQELSTYDKLIIHMLNGERIEYNMNEVRNVTFGKAVVDEPLFKEHAVDLGLSVLWSDIFVGEEKENGVPEEYRFGALIPGFGEGTEFDPKWKLFNKDNNSICGTDRDVAHVKFGGKWRMPTTHELNELFEKCSFEFNTTEKTVTIIGPSLKSITLKLRYYHQWGYTCNRVTMLSGELYNNECGQHLLACHVTQFDDKPADRFENDVRTSSRMAPYCILPVMPKE